MLSKNVIRFNAMGSKGKAGLAILLLVPFLILTVTGILKLPLSGLTTGYGAGITFDGSSTVGCTITDSTGKQTQTVQSLGAASTNPSLGIGTLLANGAGSIPSGLYTGPGVAAATVQIGGGSCGSAGGSPSFNPSYTGTNTCSGQNACRALSALSATNAPTFALAMSTSAPFKLLGDTSNGNQFTQYDTGDKVSSTAPAGWQCVVSTLCNPIETSYGFSNSTASYSQWILLYEFGFVIQLQIQGDRPITQATCGTLSIFSINCTPGEVAAYNNALSSLTSNALAQGNVVLDLSINPQSLPGFVNTPYVKAGIIGAFMGANGPTVTATSPGFNGCGTLNGGGLAQINPCTGHSLIQNTQNQFGNSWTDFSSYSPQQLAALTTGNWNPSAQLVIGYKIGPKYTAYCGVSNCGGDSTVQASAGAGGGNCINAGIGGGNPVSLPGQNNVAGNACVIDYDGQITLNIPILLQVESITSPIQKTSTNGNCQYGGSFPNCNPPPPPQSNNQQANNTLKSSYTTPGAGVSFGQLIVHVQDGLTTLPIAGAQISEVTSAGGGGCSSTQGGASTDQNGNWNFGTLQPGSYVVCGSANSGAVSLFFFNIGVVYTPNQISGVTVSAGTVTTITLILQPNIIGAFTWLAIGLMILAIIIIIFAVVLSRNAGTRILTVGTSVLRSARGRKK